MNTIGDKIKKNRVSNNMTQKDLADILFVSDKTVSSWEQSRTYPDLETINRISKIFKCSISSILFDDINKGDIETEIKIKLSDLEFKNILNKFSKKYKNTNVLNEIDYYYEVPSFNDNEWLRIRNCNNRTTLTYKKWYQNKYCDEFEVYIDNKDNLSKIFEMMGCKLLVIVEKKRIQFIIDNKYELSFDEVNNLGKFLEIEVIDYKDTPDKEYDNLIEYAISLGLNLNNISNKRYPEYFL